MLNETCIEHSGITSKIEHLEKSNEDQWTAINQLRNRLPVWATIVISLLTFLLGCSITYASFAVRLASTVNASTS